MPEDKIRTIWPAPVRTELTTHKPTRLPNLEFGSWRMAGNWTQTEGHWLVTYVQPGKLTNGTPDLSVCLAIWE